MAWLDLLLIALAAVIRAYLRNQQAQGARQQDESPTDQTDGREI